MTVDELVAKQTRIERCAAHMNAASALLQWEPFPEPKESMMSPCPPKMQRIQDAAYPLRLAAAHSCPGRHDNMVELLPEHGISLLRMHAGRRRRTARRSPSSATQPTRSRPTCAMRLPSPSNAAACFMELSARMARCPWRPSTSRRRCLTWQPLLLMSLPLLLMANSGFKASLRRRGI